jgi:hypothetical protein
MIFERGARRAEFGDGALELFARGVVVCVGVTLRQFARSKAAKVVAPATASRARESRGFPVGMRRLLFGGQP